MILTWMLYAILVSLLLAGAARVAERSLRPYAIPVRWVWAAAMATSVLLPLAAVAFHPDLAPGDAASSALPTAKAVSTAPALPTLPGPPSLPARLDPAAIALWLLLTGAVGTMVLRGFIRLRWRRAEWTVEAVDDREVLVSDGIGPAIVGLLRPAIVLPRWALALDPRDRELMLRHEEEHRRSGDAQLLAGTLLLLVAFPWNLPLWWQASRLRLAVEVDCDHRVLRTTPELSRYARLLLEIARRSASFSAPGVRALALARPVPFLERRISMMTSRPTGGVLRTTALALVGTLLVLGACQVDRPSITEAGPANDPLETVTQPDPAAGPIDLSVRTEGSAVTGVLRDRETGEPIAGAQVVLEGLEMGGLSNVQGRFLLVNVPGGTHTLLIHHDDYASDLRAAVTVEGEPAAEAGEGEFIPRVTPPGAGGPAITGTVVAPGSGAVIPAAQVYIRELDKGSLTNVQGRFLILGVPPGTHTLTVEHEELGTFEIEVDVGEDGTTSLGEISPPMR